MSITSSISKYSLLIAVVFSVPVSALLGAAALGIWTENLHFHPTPRINSLTVGLGLIPVPTVAWVVYIWTRKPTDGILDIALRVVISGSLAAAVYYSLLTALFFAFFVS